RAHVLDANVEPGRKRLDNALRTVEVPVLGAPSAADDRVGNEPGHELRSLVDRHDPRRNALVVLRRNVRCEASQGVLAVRKEEVTATPEPEWNSRLEVLLSRRIEVSRLTRQPASDRRASLAPNASRLNPGSPGTDPATLEHGNA